METISLCMIVRNEIEVLERCLKSAAGLYDELVIVDTGSEDGTPELARQFTQRVFSFPWRDNFSAARNFAFDQAVSAYCMWLDADDVLLPADRDAFLAVRSAASFRRRCGDGPLSVPPARRLPCPLLLPGAHPAQRALAALGRRSP